MNSSSRLKLIITECSGCKNPEVKSIWFNSKNEQLLLCKECIDIAKKMYWFKEVEPNVYQVEPDPKMEEESFFISSLARFWRWIVQKAKLFRLS